MSSKSLRSLIRKPAARTSIFKLYSTIDNLDERNAVILLTSVLEVGLERLLRARMRKLNSDDDKAIFSGTSPLATFSAKIRLAYAFQIIGPSTRHDLAAFNDIRNVYAHAPHQISLKNERLWRRVLGIKMVESARKSRIERGWKKLLPDEKRMTRKRELLQAMLPYAAMLSYGRHPRIKTAQYKGSVFGIRNMGSLHL